MFSNAVLHWIRDAGEVLARVRAALKPGGRFVAEFGGRGNVGQIVQALEQLAPQFGVPGFKHPWYYPSVAEYASLVEGHGLEVRFATLFDRPTPLDGKAGLRNWIEMFAGGLLEQVAADRRDEFLSSVEQALRATLYRDGVWTADYRRLRIVAVAE